MVMSESTDYDAPQHDTRARFCEVRLRVVPREWVPGVWCPACEANRITPPEEGQAP
jgi:hypothetical protein